MPALRRNMQKEMIPMLSEDENTPEKAVLDLINKLQKEKKTFDGTNYDPPERTMELMNKVLNTVFRATIVEIYAKDASFGALVCHAFFGVTKYITSTDDRRVNSDMWSSCVDPLYALLVAAYVSTSMIKFYEHLKRNPEDFRAAHENFEEEAYLLLDEVYKDNDIKLEFHVLAKDYESKYRTIPQEEERGIVNLPERKSIKRRKKEASLELLAVAYKGKCMKFISHVACQEYIRLRWEKGFVTSDFTLAHPSPIENDSDTFQSASRSSITLIGMNDIRVLGYGNDQIGYSRKTPVFTPQRKFILHLIFLIFYLISFAYVMITKPFILKKGSEGHILGIVLLVYVIITQMVQTGSLIIKIFGLTRANNFFWSDSGVKRSFFRCILEALNIIVLIALIIIVGSSFYALVYGINGFLFVVIFAWNAISSLRYLSIFSFFGSKIELLLETAKSIGKYMVLFSFFWITYSICYLSLTDSIRHKDDSTLWQILQSGAFEILGESLDEDRGGNFNCTTNLYWMDVFSLNATDPEDVRCFFRGTLVPPLLFFYMMTAAVMLLHSNFNFAFMHEYERTVEYADRYSKFHKYGMLARFESKLVLPRPLNIAYILLYYVVERFCLSWMCKFCCSPISCICLSYIEGRPWGSTPPDAIVNEEEAARAINTALSKRERCDFATIVQEYLSGLSVSYGSKLDDAEKIFMNILNLYKDFMKGQTQQTRERVATMQDMAATSTTPPPLGDLFQPIQMA